MYFCRNFHLLEYLVSQYAYMEWSFAFVVFLIVAFINISRCDNFSSDFINLCSNSWPSYIHGEVWGR